MSILFSLLLALGIFWMWCGTFVPPTGLSRWTFLPAALIGSVALGFAAGMLYRLLEDHLA